MKFNRGGTSTTKPPLLDRTNCAYWKVMVIAFLRAIDDEVWDVVEECYTRPTVVADGQTILKTNALCTQEEKQASSCNNKAINAILNVFIASEFRRICTSSSTKVAWDILQTVHEGRYIVKQTKLQNLITTFESLRMKDFETLDEFDAKLSDIVNSSFNLGESICEVRILKKILRSLPKRFRPKVVGIKEYQNLNSLAVEKLVGNLKTFEANHCSGEGHCSHVLQICDG